MDKIFVGFEPREADAFAVTVHSIRKNEGRIPIHALILDDLIKKGLYRRPTENGWDVISDAPMATEFAISRFLTPVIAGSGLALFMDCDMLVRAPLMPLFAMARQHPEIALWCVKHDHRPTNTLKMDGVVQTTYDRKNWSSVMLFNCDHKANKLLTVDSVNTVKGLRLHQLSWLRDNEIGELPSVWNYLVGHMKFPNPNIVHFTDGVPSMQGYENCEYADEWREMLKDWARCL